MFIIVELAFMFAKHEELHMFSEVLELKFSLPSRRIMTHG